MATFVLTCIDRPDALERRLAARADHLAYVRERLAMVKLAGPFLNEASEMAGSMFVIEAPDRAAVEAFAAGDPYRAADVFERVEIWPWTATVGALG
jgi:uncharacterized protein YciI